MSTDTAAADTGPVVVIGGGIAGLAAAYELKCNGVEAVVLEAGDRPGGCVDESRVGGISVDSGPDGFVARDPAAAELCRRIGLGGELVTPASSGACVFVDGGLLPLPDRSVLGVPWTADALEGAGIVSEAGAEALRLGLARDAEPLAGDATVGEVLRPRVGDEVFERLVDPLLGGINAGSADRMSIEACAAPLHEAACRGGPLGAALQQAAASQGSGGSALQQAAAGQGSGGSALQQAAAGQGNDGSALQQAAAGQGGGVSAAGRPAVFWSVRGGVARLVVALAAELGDAVSLSTPVRRLSPAKRAGGGRRWRVATPNGTLEADAVVAACPAWESARLLERLAPDAAGVLGDIEYADVALATFVVAGEHLARPLDASGFLVPRSTGLLTTACSWSSSKWQHYAGAGRAVLRVSAGRTDDRRWMDLDPDDLVSTLAGELAETGVVGRDAVTRGCLEARLRPWRRSLPQYRPGHLDRIAAMEACLAGETPGLAAAGAALRGVGLPACIRSGQHAAAAVAGAQTPRAHRL